VNRRTSIRAFVVLGTLVLGWLLRAVTAPLLAAYLLMLILEPLSSRLQPRVGSNGAAFTCLALLFTVPLLLLAPAMSQFDTLAGLLPGANSTLLASLETELQKAAQNLPPSLQQELDLSTAIDQVGSKMGDFQKGLQQFLGGAFGMLTAFFLIPIFFFFLLRGGPWPPRIRKELPQDWHVRYDRILPRIEAILSSYVVARVGVAFWKGLIVFLLLLALNFPAPYALGLLAGVFSLLPVLGPLLAFIAIALVGIADGGVSGGGLLGLAAASGLYLLTELIEAYILLPRLVGRGLGLSDFAVILAVLCGGALAGVFGLLLAVPAVAVGLVLYDEFVRPFMVPRPVD
jgi:predicted PurR-regulated permease PerM